MRPNPKKPATAGPKSNIKTAPKVLRRHHYSVFVPIHLPCSRHTATIFLIYPSIVQVAHLSFQPRIESGSKDCDQHLECLQRWHSKNSTLTQILNKHELLYQVAMRLDATIFIPQFRTLRFLRCLQLFDFLTFPPWTSFLSLFLHQIFFDLRSSLAMPHLTHRSHCTQVAMWLLSLTSLSPNPD